MNADSFESSAKRPLDEENSGSAEKNSYLKTAASSVR